MLRRKTYYSERPDPVKVVPVSDGSVVFLRENIEEIQTEDGATRFQADEYSLHSRSGPLQLLERITRNFAAWLDKAKEQEASAAAADAAKLTLDDLAGALVELGELLAEQDDALVELAELIEEGV